MILVLDERTAEADLAAGLVSCGCGGRVAPWGHARLRSVRQRAGVHMVVCPRRGRCKRCGRTHVILPAHSLPRRRDATEVIGTALRLAAIGRGHRAVAEALALPASTVRNWLRRARELADQLYAVGTRTAHAIDATVDTDSPQATPLADAVEALGRMAAVVVRRLGPVGVGPWCLIAVLTGGLLVPRRSSA